MQHQVREKKCEKILRNFVLGQGDNRGALREVQRALELDPNLGFSYYVQGLINIDLKQFKEAAGKFIFILVLVIILILLYYFIITIILVIRYLL